jgi:anhydro-N-acetylmuramic acid kinase
MQRYLFSAIFSINPVIFTDMKKNRYHVIGVMSGTSLDGIDLAELIFTTSEGWDFELLASETLGYPSVWKQRLQEAMLYSEMQLKELNADYTKYLSEVILAFIQKHQIENLDAVCSHGHTILHQPEKGITLQIGNLPELSKLVQQKVVCDFRTQDVELGGQGAPLVPIGDRMLFSDYDYCLNLGGFANCSFEKEGVRIAFDICPVNIVLNVYAEKLGFPYDDKGKIASAGVVHEPTLILLNNLSFYKEMPPKSLGLEWVKEHIFPILKASEISSEDILRTFIEHSAKQIGSQFQKGTSVLVTGGGAYNEYLLSRIYFYKDVELNIPSKELIEYKESLVFGLLGVLKLRNEVNCLASVTGAERDHSSGKIFEC